MEEIVKAPDRLKVLERILEFEKSGEFNRDVEDDPPFEYPQSMQIDYLNKKIMNKLKTVVANYLGKRFYYGMMKNKRGIFCGQEGLENLKGFHGGAIVTCNHINIFDNAAVYLGLEKHFIRPKLYKVIKEGNYFLPGKIGFIMRHSNTLPLCRNHSAMSDFMNAAETILKKNKLLLIYPEQAMWWNYKKPRPMKNGAFKLAAKFNVPVIPCFITLKDNDKIGEDGFPVQEYTLHILPLIYADKDASVNENCESMKNKNLSLWQEVYDKVYDNPLTRVV